MDANLKKFRAACREVSPGFRTHKLLIIEVVLMPNAHSNADKTFLVILATVLEQGVVVVIRFSTKIARHVLVSDMFAKLTSS